MNENFKKNTQVTFALYAYNQDKYIREAVEAILNQDFSCMEIILSDDCSSDRTFEIMKEIVNGYAGQHKVLLIKNATNLGVGNHINNVLNVSSGDIIIHAAGDDISMPNRARHIYNHFLKAGAKTAALFSNVLVIDDVGVINGLFFKKTPNFSSTIDEFKLNRRCWALGCSLAFRRSIYDKYGELNPNVRQEDGVLAFRSMLEGRIDYVDTPLVKYRIHDSNVSQTENSSKLIFLKKNAHFMIRSWHADTLLSGMKDVGLLKIIEKELFMSLLKKYFFSIPFVGRVYLYSYIKIYFLCRYIIRKIRRNPHKPI